MNKFSYKLATGMATGALLLSAFAPAAFADTTVDITSNGAHSDNTVNVNANNGGGTSVTQTNTTTVVTQVNATANTGGNHANGNTGGDVTINTGDAANAVTVDVTGGSNSAVLPDACGCDGDVSVTIARNGAHSDNTVNIGSGVWNCGCLTLFGLSTTGTTVKQKNNTSVGTSVTVKAKTGKNKANNNTRGNTRVRTGNAANSVSVTVTGSSNDLY